MTGIFFPLSVRWIGPPVVTPAPPVTPPSTGMAAPVTIKRRD